jgi:hypothetical protein
VSYRIDVKGLQELRAALKEADGGLKDFRGELVKAGEPVREEATALGARFAGIGPYRVRARGATVSVEQSASKVTGQRGDFGALQMRVVLEPALDARQQEVVSVLEEVVAGLIDRAGL